MDLLQSIHQLSKLEKIKVMEFIWNELTLEEQEFSSPKWHEKALKETEERMSKGEEKVINWSDAKKLLRKEFK